MCLKGNGVPRLFHVEAFAPFRVWGLDRVEEAAADLVLLTHIPPPKSDHSILNKTFSLPSFYSVRKELLLVIDLRILQACMDKASTPLVQNRLLICPQLPAILKPKGIGSDLAI